jgi:hypothetical protein
MKKLIAILAVFAFLGAALFAQDAGTWSISGNGQINTRIHFIPLFQDGSDPQAKHATIFQHVYGDDGISNQGANGEVRGNLSLGYSKGIISTGISFNQRGAIGVNVQANGDGFQFRASRDLINLLAANAFGDRDIDLEFNTNDGTNNLDGTGTGTVAGWDLRGWSDLWGNYTFSVLNGIFLEAAVNKEGSLWEQGFDSWTHHDRLSRNYLLVNVKPMAGLEFGFKMPELYTTDQKDFMDDVLRRMVFGVKYDVAPITVAFQLGLNGYGLDYATAGNGAASVTTAPGGTIPALNFNYAGNSNRIYFGARYVIAPGIDAGVYFRGDFGYKLYTERGNDETPKTDGKTIDTAEIIFGGSVNYSAGPLGAGLTFRFRDPNTAGTSDAPKYYQDQWFRIGVSARYDVLPDNLRAKLAFELEIPMLGSELAKTRKETAARTDQAQYTFTPEIIYNFLGTGAGDDPGVGMRIKYRIQGRFEAAVQAQNELTVAFKWSF